MRTLFALLVLGGVAQAQPPSAQAPVQTTESNARLYAWIGTGATVALAASTAFVYIRRSQIAETNSLGTGPCDAACQDQRNRDTAARQDRLATYRTLTVALGVSTVVAGAVTAYLWTRTENTYTSPVVTFRVDPQHGGAEVGWLTRF